MSLLPKDDNNNTIQVFTPARTGGAHHIEIGTKTACNTTAFDTGARMIWVYAPVDCYYRLGGSDVVATTSDHFMAGKTWCPIGLTVGDGSQTQYIAFITNGAGGTVHISEQEG
jgi:hypothetical protein